MAILIDSSISCPICWGPDFLCTPSYMHNNPHLFKIPLRFQSDSGVVRGDERMALLWGSAPLQKSLRHQILLRCAAVWFSSMTSLCWSWPDRYCKVSSVQLPPERLLWSQICATTTDPVIPHCKVSSTMLLPGQPNQIPQILSTHGSESPCEEPRAKWDPLPESLE